MTKRTALLMIVSAGFVAGAVPAAQTNGFLALTSGFPLVRHAAGHAQRGDGDVMKPSVEKLTEDDLIAISAYVASLTP